MRLRNDCAAVQDENEQLRCDAAKQDTVIAQLRDALLTEEAKLIQTQEEYAIALQLSDRAHRHRLADTITTLSSEQKLEREGTVSALNERMERTTEAHAATLRETGERCAPASDASLRWSHSHNRGNCAPPGALRRQCQSHCCCNCESRLGLGCLAQQL